MIKRRDFLKKSSILGFLSIPSLFFGENKNNKNDILKKEKNTISKEEREYLNRTKCSRFELMNI